MSDIKKSVKITRDNHNRTNYLKYLYETYGNIPTEIARAFLSEPILIFPVDFVVCLYLGFAFFMYGVTSVSLESIPSYVNNSFVGLMIMFFLSIPAFVVFSYFKWKIESCGEDVNVRY
jgi:hypothetical protein